MIIQGDFVHTPYSQGQLKILHNHVLEVDRNGFISSIRPYQSSLSIDPIIRIPSGSFLLPAFCDLHLHAPQFLYQGTGLHLPLMEWLNRYAFTAEERIDTDSTLAHKVYRRLAERLIDNGTGSVMLFGTIKSETNLILAEVMQEAGIRAFVGKVSMDVSSRSTYLEPSAIEAIEAARSFIHDCRALFKHLAPHECLIEPVITPRFIPTCSEELLSGLGELAKTEGPLRIQSHMAESKDQVDLVQAERGVDDVTVFNNMGLLTPHTVQAHCTFLDPTALDHLAQTKTSVAHCPLSNSYFSAKPFPLREALDRGVKVGLGSDIAGGYELGIMGAMRMSVIVSRIREGDRIAHGQTAVDDTPLSIDWKESLYLATRGGALALGLPNGSGTFQVGAPFDAQLIQVYDTEQHAGVGPLDFWDVDEKEFRLTEEMIEKWWCLGDTRNKRSMWVQGIKIH